MMNHEQIVDALNSLVPDAKWQLTGNDYADIVWIEGNKPTLEQLQNELEMLPVKKAQAEAEAAVKKAAAEAKLAALGLTADDLKALGLGGN
jgi:hypothetical protein